MAQRELGFVPHAGLRSVGRMAFELARAFATVAWVLAVTVVGGLLVRGVRRNPSDPGTWLSRPWLWAVATGAAIVLCAVALRSVHRRRRRDSASD